MMVFSLIDIAMAYRKVKIDLFYSGNPCRLALAEFEKNIERNIAQLKKVLDNNDLEFIFSCCRNNSGIVYLWNFLDRHRLRYRRAASFLFFNKTHGA